MVDVPFIFAIYLDPCVLSPRSYFGKLNGGEVLQIIGSSMGGCLKLQKWCSINLMRKGIVDFNTELKACLHLF